MEAPITDLYLRKGADKRLRTGHLWVYSNEVDTKRSPLSHFEAGACVNVMDAGGHVLGSAYMEPQSLICARIYAPERQCYLDFDVITGHLLTALAGREAAFDKPFYRLVYGDSDLLPGLVVDRFGDYLVMQLNNAGIERYEQEIIAALVSALQPVGILLRADSRSRREQGLPNRIEVVHGQVPKTVELEENNVGFIAPVWEGQKTGWFYDHRMSRARLATYVPDKSVLDVYSYIGGWGIQAAAFGASEVTCLDSSATALDGVQSNAEFNNVAAKVSTRLGLAAETMATMRGEGLLFDVVIFDQPAFIQRRKDIN
jgi:23S rRNA (cytosine1962-C5)-methyltransferase